MRTRNLAVVPVFPPPLPTHISHGMAQGTTGITGVIRLINDSKVRMTHLKQEIAAATNRFRQGYQDDGVLLSMILEGERKLTVALGQRRSVLLLVALQDTAKQSGIRRAVFIANINE